MLSLAGYTLYGCATLNNVLMCLSHPLTKQQLLMDEPRITLAHFTASVLGTLQGVSICTRWIKHNIRAEA